jgi:type IV pilus assembly protein PilP
VMKTQRAQEFIGGALIIIGMIWLATALAPRSMSQEPPPLSEALPPELEGAPPVPVPPQVVPQQAAPPAVQQPDVNQPADQVPQMQSGVAQDGFVYDPTGKRDPFQPFAVERPPVVQVKEEPIVPTPSVMTPVPVVPTTPLQGFDLDQLKLVGVIWDVRNPKAMVRDPVGKLHIVRKDTKIGRNSGFVSTIREGEIVVIEPMMENGLPTAATRVLSLTRN